MGDGAERVPTIELLVLGELVVRRDRAIVRLPGQVLRSLLGVLLLTPGEVVREDRILELAWGAGAGSRRALQCAAHRLRAWLHGLAGPACRLEHFGSGYRLAVPSGALDLTRFRDLAAASTTGDPSRRLDHALAALREWRGPVLGGHPEWLAADPLVRTIEQDRIDSALLVADLAMQEQRPAEVVAAVAQVAAGAPYDEPLHARLVRLLTVSGRHAEAIRLVERVRGRLEDDLGIAPSAEIRSAHAAALRDDRRLAPIPRQLPSDLPDFTGRHAETLALRDPAPARRSALVAVLHGMAGVGKSALAVHVAHLQAAVHADGQLYAELRGAAPVEVLAWFLRALGVGMLPGSFAERVALYRSLTADRRILVVLDDAVDEEQVRPLVPGSAGSTVLVTSRGVLAGLAGARQLPVAAMAADDAVELLSRVARRPGLRADPAARQIVQRCDGLPLAVRAAGARLATRPALTPHRLAQLLADDTRVLDELTVGDLDVRARLRAGLADLPLPVADAFRQLGRLPFAAAPDGAHLEALVDAGLLVVTGPGYHLPRLLRLHSAELTAESDPRAGCERM